MEHVQPVLWHEGMFLTPHLFQQADRRADWQLARALRAARALCTGFAELELDREAVATDTLAIRRAAGVMGDGTVFAMPEGDPLPAPRPFAALFTSQVERLAAYLCLPAIQPGTPLIGEAGRDTGETLRHRREQATVRDAVAGGDEREIAIAPRDWRIRFAGEPMDGWVALRLGELIRSPAGGFQLAEDHAPPALALAAAPAVLRTAKRIADICVARASELAGGRRSRVAGVVEFSASESASYLLLHTLNGAIPGLLHLLRQGGTHPEALHLHLAGLAGSLHTFSGEGQSKDVPAYDHERPMAGFAALEARLRELLESRITARYTPLIPEKRPGGIHVAKMPETVLSGHRIYLSVSSSAPSDKVMAQTPVKAKVASAGRVPQLVAQAMKGMALSYLSVPPAEIPAQPGSSYFALACEGEEWELVAQTRTLAIHLPPDFTDLRLEFMAVKDD